ncbi:MAG: hypothetical protein HYV66_00115 [Candidatus Sungbacteria bacterium]|uniref:Uncharacterized protein n=1 Tax=Candidatus Sungiibacteriota bacterium TaxID=2750080 RepID=A0A932DS17_9BACT|nr:hypothetical protein [Candidatus Sungbacteria bacterium]
MAKKKAVVGPDLTPDWLEKRTKVMGEIDAQLIRGLREPGKGLTLDDLQLVVEHRSIRMDVSSLFFSHHSFYPKFFGLNPDLSTVRIPLQRPDFTRLLIIAQGLTPNRVYEACQKHFPCWRYTGDLDSALDWDQEERDPRTATYAIWVKNTPEADDNLKNLSAIQIKARGLTTETLTERLLHELMYWSETGQHLDSNTITLCSGSRHQDGSVPRVRWRWDKFGVDWYGPRNADGGLRARAVVS